MTSAYREHGVRFRVPDGWNVTEHHDEERLSITVAGPDAAFWSLSVLFDRPYPLEVVETALAAFRDEYPEMDEYPATASLGGIRGVGRDVEFVCLEMINNAGLRAFRTADRTLFVFYQYSDLERAEAEPLLAAINASLECDDDPEDDEF